MRRNRDLESRLSEWGREYGGGKYQDIGYGSASPLAFLMKWQGKPPSRAGGSIADCAADEVQEAVQALSMQEHGRIPASVIRCEYLTPGQPVEMKLERMRSWGDNLGRVRYYQHLRVARMHVAAWIKVPFSDPTEDERKEISSAALE